MSESVFADRLRTMRKGAGLTLQELGDACGVSRQAIFSYERQGKYPSGKILVAICQRLGVSADYLFAPEAPPLPPRLMEMAYEIQRWVSAAHAGSVLISEGGIQLEEVAS